MKGENIMYIKMRFPNGVSKTLTLSYDDGPDADVRFMSIMSKNGLKGTFNLNSSMFFGDGDSRKRADRLKKLYIDSQNEVACHGVYHPKLEKLPLPAMIHEILNDRENLEKEFDTIVRGMAYPYGSYDANVLQALKLCGIGYSRTVCPTGDLRIPDNWLELAPTCHHDDSRLWDITDRFLKTEGDIDPMLFYVWGHTYEFDRHNNWERFEEFAAKVGNRDDVWYATNIQVYDYIEGFKRLSFSADSKIVHNPNSFKVWFSADGKIVDLDPDETKRI